MMGFKIKDNSYIYKIIYALVFMILFGFVFLYSNLQIKENFKFSLFCLLSKLIIFIVILLFCLYRYFKNYTKYIKSIKVDQYNLSSIKWLLKKNNLKIFIKFTLLITPLIIFIISQSNDLHRHVIGENKVNTFACIIESDLSLDFLSKNNQLKKDITKILINGQANCFANFWIKFLNNNKLIDLILSSIISGLLLSFFIILCIYIICKILMNKYFKEIKKQFNHIFKKASKLEKEKEKITFEKIILEYEVKQKAIENDRFFTLYTIIDQKLCDFWKEVKKSTTPPLFNCEK